MAFGLQDKNFKLSPSSGNYTSSAFPPTDVTNLTVTIVCSGLVPVFGTLVPAGASAAWVRIISGSNARLQVLFIRDVSTTVGTCEIQTALSGVSNTQLYHPPGGFVFFDTPTKGSKVYKVQHDIVAGTSTAFTDLKLLVYEL